jgi:AcrR family transcriptional regulator
MKVDNMGEMSVEERPLRADAERNRKRLLEAAMTLFRERGLEVSVTEIAQAAGVGRGTLFRNFASKEDLIAAIVADRMEEAASGGEALLQAEDPGEALFEFLGDLIGRQQLDHAVADAIEETWLARDEIRCAHAEFLGVLERLLKRAQRAGCVRADVGATDVLMLFKGACVAASAFGHGDPEILARHLDLIRAGLTASPEAAPLRGRAPTLEEIEAGDAA